MPDTPHSPKDNEHARKIRFFYEKSRAHRGIHVDGAIGALTAGGMVHMALFNERVPIPQQSVFTVENEGLSASDLPEERVTKDGVIREVEVSVYMSLSTAANLRDWLSNQLSEAERVFKVKLS